MVACFKLGADPSCMLVTVTGVRDMDEGWKYLDVASEYKSDQDIKPLSIVAPKGSGVENMVIIKVSPFPLPAGHRFAAPLPDPG